MSDVQVADITIHYRFDGPENGPVLMLSNSLGTNLHMWDAQIPGLSRDFTVLRYDVRGHGSTTVATGLYTIEMLGRDAIGLLDALKIDKVAFCGLSLGGMTGMWLGAHVPERIEKLVLCNTSAQLGPPSAWQDRMETVTQHGIAAIADIAIERWFTPPFRAAASPELARFKEMLLATPPAGYAGCCAAIRDMDLRRDIEKIKLPTLIIAGADDPATPVSPHSTLMQEKIPGSRLVVLERAAHLSNIERAEAFTDTVSNFLKS